MSHLFERYKARPGAEALQDLLRAHQDAIYNVCYQVLRSDPDAQDAAQQVLLNLLDDLPKIVDAEHFRRWLYRASFQVALDARKMRGRRMAHEQKAKPVAAADEGTADLLHEHVAALDDDLRALVAEHYFEQKPLAALAEARGVSTNAVWKKLERAKEKLKDSMTKAGYASALPSLDGLLASITPVAAPKGLLSKSLLAKAAATASAPTLAIGAIVVKAKLILATTALLLFAAGTLAIVAVRRSAEREQPPTLTRTEPSASRKRNESKATSKTPDVPAAAAPAEPVAALDMMAFMEALRKAMTIPDQGARWKEYQRIGITLKDEDFRKLESTIHAKQGSKEYYSTAFSKIISAWLSADSKRVIDLFRTMPPHREMTKAEANKALLVNVAHFNPEAALAYAKGLPEEEGRTALVDLLTPMTASGARDAAERARQMPPGDARHDALGKAVAAWANSDLKAAADWAEASLSADERKSALWGALESMGGRQNSAVAGEICLKIFKGKELYSLAVEQVVKNWVETDPAAAGEFLLRLPVLDEKGYPQNSRQNMSIQVGHKWALLDPAAALAWAGQRLEGEERQVALRAIGGAIVNSVHSDPAQALGLVQTLPEKERKPVMEAILGAWAETDPNAAVAVALSFPGGPVGTGVISNVWAARDSEAALAWSRTLSPGEARDAALKGVCFEIDGRDSENALRIASEISDPSVRVDTLKTVVLRWAEKNPQAALDGISRSNLQDSEKALLRKTVEQNPKPKPPPKAEQAPK